MTLARTTPLQRRTRLAPGKPLERRTRVKARSPRRRAEEAELAESNRVVRARSGGRCEIGAGPCRGRADRGAHHIKGRGMGGHGDHSPENLLDCCTPCHDYAHDGRNRAEAERRGWIRRRNR